MPWLGRRGQALRLLITLSTIVTLLLLLGPQIIRIGDGSGLTVSEHYASSTEAATSYPDAAVEANDYLNVTLNHGLLKRAPVGKVVLPFTSEEIDTYKNDGRSACDLMMGTIGDVNKKFIAAYGPDPLSLAWQRSAFKESLFYIGIFAWSRSDYDPRDVRDTDVTSAPGKDTWGPIVTALENMPVGSLPEFDGDNPWRVARSVNAELFDDGPNVPRKWIQSNRFHTTRPHTNNRETKAYVAAVYNPVDGVIVCQRHASAQWLIKQTWEEEERERVRVKAKAKGKNKGGRPAVSPEHRRLAKLIKMSDVLRVQWSQLHSQNQLAEGRSDSLQDRKLLSGKPANNLLKMLPPDAPSRYRTPLWYYEEQRHWLNYIVHEGPNDEDLRDSANVYLRTVRTCLASRGIANNYFPTWRERHTFAIGHWCYYALLGMKSNENFVDFLVQRKLEPPHSLGNKVFTSVTIFWPDEEHQPSGSWPVLIWKIGDVDQGVQAIKERLEAQWTQQFVHGHFNEDGEFIPGYMATGNINFVSALVEVTEPLGSDDQIPVAGAMRAEPPAVEQQETQYMGRRKGMSRHPRIRLGTTQQGVPQQGATTDEGTAQQGTSQPGTSRQDTSQQDTSQQHTSPGAH